MNYSKLMLGTLLGYPNETIKRNAMSILKTLQKEKGMGLCYACETPTPYYYINDKKKKVYYCDNCEN